MKRPGVAAGALDDERLVKARLAAAREPQPSPDFLGLLTRIGQPPARRAPALGSQRPPGRVDGVGPGRAAASARSRPGGPGPGRRARNRCIAAAGLAASVMVGIGSGALGGGGGTGVANQPAQPRPSSVVETVSVAAPSAVPVQFRALVRPTSRTLLSVVYRRP